MCGGYLSITKEEMEEIRIVVEEENRRLGQVGNPLEVLGVSFDSRKDIVPSLLVPAIAMEEGRVVIKPMKWGFSRWDGKGSVINARVESIESKPFFRESFLHNRCIIPSLGFYEWKHDEDPSNIFFDALREMDSKKKMNLDALSGDTNTKIDILDDGVARQPYEGLQSDLVFKPDEYNISIPGGSKRPSRRRAANSQKYLIRKSDSDIFLMAGIYQIKGGVTEFTIITMPAAKSLESIHDRMPLYLENAQIMQWLSNAGSLGAILAALSPLASFTTVPV